MSHLGTLQHVNNISKLLFRSKASVVRLRGLHFRCIWSECYNVTLSAVNDSRVRHLESPRIGLLKSKILALASPISCLNNGYSWSYWIGKNGSCCSLFQISLLVINKFLYSSFVITLPQSFLKSHDLWKYL